MIASAAFDKLHHNTLVASKPKNTNKRSLIKKDLEKLPK